MNHFPGCSSLSFAYTNLIIIKMAYLTMVKYALVCSDLQGLIYGIKRKLNIRKIEGV